MLVMGWDPGQSGGIVKLDHSGVLTAWQTMVTKGESKDIDFDFLQAYLATPAFRPDHIFLERAVSFGMGSKGAFNYGRGFAAVEIAIKLSGIPVTYVEPSKWTKAVWEGTPAEWKPKNRSLAAAERLMPEALKLLPKGPKSGKIHDGLIDALLIAEYGRRQLFKNA